MGDLLTDVEFQMSKTFIVEMFNGWMGPITKGQRVELMDALLDQYCQHCGDGAENYTWRCHCTNDE